MTFPAGSIDVDRRGRELTRHGSEGFPLACYHDDLSLQSVPWHWHEELEALVVIEGTTVVAAGTEKFTLTAGQGIFINAGVLHGAWSGCTNRPAAFFSLVFHPRLVGGSMESVFWQDYITPLMENRALRAMPLGGDTAWQAEALRAIETAWRCCTAESPGYVFHARSALSQLVFLLCSHSKSESQPLSAKALRTAERSKTMVQFIQTHYAEELTTAEIARSAAVSESECLRCFRATIGISPIRYLRQFRVQKAIELLDGTAMKVAEVGARCGFSDNSYFTKVFHELKGCSPSEWRERKKGSYND